MKEAKRDPNPQLTRTTFGVEAATNLWDRLDALRAGVANSDCVPFVLWRDRIASHDKRAFDRRLKLARVVQPAASGAHSTSTPATFDVGLLLKPRPYVAPMDGAPLGGEARAKQIDQILRKLAGEECDELLQELQATKGLSHQGTESARAGLLARLMAITNQILVHEFKRYALRATAGSVSWDIRNFSDAILDSLAGQFLDDFLNLPDKQLRDYYPVWARLRDLEVRRWATHIRALTRRLQEDRPILEEVFGVALDDALVGMSSSGDTHRDGKSVHILFFESGKRLVYKPRSGCMDVWYRDLLRFISEQPLVSLNLEAPIVADRGEYVWIEFIPHEQSADPQVELHFYQRMGMLLAVWGLFGGTDGHFENVIARGAMPYVVDTETLFDGFGPLAKISGRQTADQVCMQQLLNSVKRVGFLPTYLYPNEKVGHFDMSAIGLRAPIPAPFPVEDIEQRIFRCLGILGAAKVELKPQGNVPKERSGPLGAALVEAVTRGFSEVYDVMDRRRTDIIRRVRQLAANSTARVRVVPRPTHLYSRLLTESLTPSCLRDGAKRSIEIDRVSMKFTDRAPSRFDGEMLAAEIHALENLEIPLFDLPLQSRPGVPHSCDRSGRISRRRYGSPAKTAIALLRGCCERDKALQLRLIRETLLMDDGLRIRGNMPEMPVAAGRFTWTPKEALEREKIWESVLRIERSITAAAVHGDDGSVGWIGPRAMSGKGHHQHEVMGGVLYGGASGVALFYAALFRVTGDTSYRMKAIGALHSLVDSIQRAERRGPKAAGGLLREIYTLVVCGKLLGEPSLVEPARVILGCVTERTLRSDSAFDVIAGSAGTILSALSVWGETRDPLALAVAKSAGAHLLKSRVTTSSGLRAWNTLKAPLAGFAHGVAGIALSLERLAAASGDSRFRDASLEALVYERTLYDPTHRNWADLRQTASGGPASYMPLAWCHGAPGIGMAYLGISDIRSDDLIEESISLARQASLEAPRSQIDTVCCGMFGRAALCDLLARRRGDGEMAALRDSIVSDFLERGPLRAQLVEGVSDFILSTGFFNGLSGIGYELIRMYIDRDLPAIMMWD